MSRAYDNYDVLSLEIGEILCKSLIRPFATYTGWNFSRNDVVFAGVECLEQFFSWLMITMIISIRFECRHDSNMDFGCIRFG